MKGYYHSKETFGTVDGQGIRYVLFLAGCSLSCAFCHNPDTWARGEKTIAVEEVLADVQAYQSFYKASGGGITVSGGEPFLQADFVAELFEKCQAEKIHTTIDTAGFYDSKHLDGVLDYTDHVLFSLKAMLSETHQYLTGKDNALILANLRYIAERCSVTVRYVIVPTVNDSEREIHALAEFIQSLSSTQSKIEVDLLAYHAMGVYKWKELGMEYKLADINPATKADVARVRKILANYDIQTIQKA